jgi:hypothetical protein
VTPGNQLTTEQYAARVKAMMDSTENKMQNEHVNLSAEDPNLSDIDEALIKLVERRLILAEEKGDKTAAKIALSSKLAGISYSHGYGDSGMYDGGGGGVIGGGMGGGAAESDAEHDPDEAAAAAAAGLPFGATAVSVSAVKAGKKASRAYSQSGDDDGLAGCLALLDQAAAKRACTVAAKEAATEAAAEVERGARRAAEERAHMMQVNANALQQEANANIARMLEIMSRSSS